jgi:hypothetical protein
MVSSLFYTVVRCLDVGLFAYRASARFGKPGAIIEHKAARQTPVRDYFKFFPDSLYRAPNMA